MIELNLLPEEIKKKRKKIRIELPEIPLIPITIGFVAVLLIIQILFGCFIFFSRKELALLTKERQGLSPKKQEIIDIKRAISNKARKVSAIESLMKNQLTWSRLLNDLSDCLTSNIWLTNLFYGEKSERRTVSGKVSAGKKKRASSTKTETRKIRTRTLTGFASGRGEATTERVARFIRSLKRSKNFSAKFNAVELVSITKSNVAGQDVMNFELVCKFKPQKR